MVFFPPAKINIGLHILRKRDDGYHDLELSFLEVPFLHDVLEISQTETDEFLCEGIPVAGKDEDGIMKTLFPPFRRVIITKPSGYKKSNPAELAERAESIFPEKDIIYIESPDAALDAALREESSILITGSFYLASEMSKLRG